jgi:hypothetical protein
MWRKAGQRCRGFPSTRHSSAATASCGSAATHRRVTRIQRPKSGFAARACLGGTLDVAIALACSSKSGPANQVPLGPGDEHVQRCSIIPAIPLAHEQEVIALPFGQALPANRKLRHVERHDQRLCRSSWSTQHYVRRPVENYGGGRNEPPGNWPGLGLMPALQVAIFLTFPSPPFGRPSRSGSLFLREGRWCTDLSALAGRFRCNAGKQCGRTTTPAISSEARGDR